MKDESLTSAAGTEAFYINLFNALPGNSILLRTDAPHYTIVAATPKYLKHPGAKSEELIGKGVFEAFPSNPADPNDTGASVLRGSLEHVLKYKLPHQLPMQRYDSMDKKADFIERYWNASNSPVFTDKGEVAYIIHTTEEITDRVKAEKREDAIRGIEAAYNFFMNAPVIIGFVKGPDYVIELANEGLLEVWGKTDDVIGKPLMQAIPELEEQGFKALLDKVCATGEPFYANEFPITLNRHGREEVIYFNFVYKPYHENNKDGRVTGVFSVGHDVTVQVLARQKVAESEAKYRNLFDSMDQGFCVLELLFDADSKPVDYRFLEVNLVFENQTGLKDAVGKTARELIPNLEAHWFDRYGKVALTGESVRFTEGSGAMGRWFDVFAFKIGGPESRKVALLFTDITNRRKGEEALRQSESNLRNIILHAPVAMCILRGPSFVVELANDRMFEIWGKAPAEMLHKPVFESLPEAGKLGLEREMHRVYTTGETFIANELAVPLPRNGVLKTTYLNFIYEAYKTGDGTITGIIAVATEITEQVLARMKVEKGHQELQFMMDAMPQLVWITKPDGYHDAYNQQWYEYTGLSHEQTKGTGWNEVLHPDDQERAWKVWRDSLETGSPYEIEYRFRRFDGAYRWFLGRALPLKDETGAILKWYGTCTDIDDQKKVTERLEQSEARTRLAVEAAHLGTFDINLINQTIIHSPRTAEIFGLDVTKQWDYTVFIDAVHPDDVAHRNKAHEKARRTGELFYELRIQLPNHTVRWIRLNGVIKFQNKIPLSLVGTVRDITEEKRAAELLEQKIEERTKELRLLNEQLSQFTYAASHDLQEPLRKISFFLSRLVSSIGHSLSEENKHNVDRIEHTTSRMRSLIDDLLAYSNTTLGITSFKEVDLADVVKEVLDDMEVTITEKRATIDLHQLPRIRGDQRQLRQLFQNLISNAVKYQKQGETPQVQISSRLVKGTEVETYIPQERKETVFHAIKVRDNGIGFHPDDSERIFRLFQRLHGKSEYPGTGVGLAIVQKVVENHKGYIWADSASGEGATFTVLLPVE
jgi:PAS domain S-box-containing protein